MMRKCLYLAACAGFVALLLVPSAIRAQVAPTLGVATQFGALGAASVVGSAAPGTVVNGDVGSYPTPTITNFPPSSVVAPFSIHRAADGVVQQAQTDARTAYDFLAAQGGAALPIPPAPDELAGRTITSGVYSLGAANLAGSTTLTLNGPGVFIFNVASSLVMNTSSVMTGTANPCNVYWRVGSSATLNGSSFMGTVLANISVTVGGGTIAGRVVALTGSVTMPTGGNTIGGCSAPPAVVCPTITLSPLTTPNGLVGVAYSQPITASGGAAPHTFTVTSGALPPGVTLTPAGLLAGTPTTAGTFTFSISGTDANGCSGTLAYTIVVAPAPVVPPQPPGCPVITFGPATLPNAIVGVPYSQTLTGSGGTGPYVFTGVGGAFPDGIFLMSPTVLSGTATVASTFTFTIRVTDANGCFADRPFVVLTATAVPTMPQVFVVVLALGLTGVGYVRLRRRARG